jgi:hypothetical protein
MATEAMATERRQLMYVSDVERMRMCAYYYPDRLPPDSAWSVTIGWDSDAIPVEGFGPTRKLAFRMALSHWERYTTIGDVKPVWKPARGMGEPAVKPALVLEASASHGGVVPGIRELTQIERSFYRAFPWFNRDVPETLRVPRIVAGFRGVPAEHLSWYALQLRDVLASVTAPPETYTFQRLRAVYRTSHWDVGSALPEYVVEATTQTGRAQGIGGVILYAPAEPELRRAILNLLLAADQQRE